MSEKTANKPDRPGFNHKIGESGLCLYCGRANYSDSPITGMACDQVPLSVFGQAMLDYIDAKFAALSEDSL